MEEEDMKLAHDLNELSVDVLQCLVVLPQGVHEVVVRVDDLARHHRAAYTF